MCLVYWVQANVLFSQFTIRDGQRVCGSAVYEPDLGSFKNDHGIFSMNYHNIYGGKSWLVIEYNAERKTYVGKKVVDEKSAGMATGMDWKMFFVHFTTLGLVKGERCEFVDVG